MRYVPLVVLLPIAAAANATVRDAPPLAAKLERIKEVRVAELAPDEDGMNNMFDEPGMELRFRVAPPDGRTIVEFTQPMEIAAVDSTGVDLTRIENNVFGEPEHVSTEMTWEGGPTAFTVKLGLPGRSATRFGLSTTLTAITYESIEVIELKAGGDLRSVDGLTAPDGTPVKAKLERQDNQVQLMMSPGTVREIIESIELLDGGNALDSQGSMWNDQSITYMFMGSAGPDATAKIAVRTGLAHQPIVIELKDQPLP